MLTSENYIDGTGPHIRFSLNTYSIFTMHSRNLKIKSDTYLLGFKGQCINKTNLYNHVKFIFPDKLMFQQIY